MFAKSSSIERGGRVSWLGRAAPLLLASLPLVGCGPPRDGELTLPTDYRRWAPFSLVHRTDVKQVREGFVNEPGTALVPGQEFPRGTVLILELYAAKMEGDKPVVGADGKLVKGDLSKILVMEKHPGWGQDVPDSLKNGTWVYGAYGADGKPTVGDDFNKCRACHAPMAKADFVYGYQGYVASRAKQ